MFNFNIQVKDKCEVHVHMMHACMVTTHGVFQLPGGVEAKDQRQLHVATLTGDISDEKLIV